MVVLPKHPIKSIERIKICVSRGQNSISNGCFAKEATIDDIFLEFVNVCLVTLAFALLRKDQRVFVSFPSLTSQREETNFITTPEERLMLKCNSKSAECSLSRGFQRNQFRPRGTPRFNG